MNIDYWKKVKHFSPKEFDSPDEAGSGYRMQESTVLMLDLARRIAGVPFHINSGYRSKSYNDRIGGVKDSAHTKGFAADIAVYSDSDRYNKLKAVTSAGFNRIGIGKSYIHVDNDPSKNEKVIWHYYKTNLDKIMSMFLPEKHDI